MRRQGKITITAGGIVTLAGIIYYETHKQQINQGADDLVHALEITVVVLIVAVVAVVAAIKIRRRVQRNAQAPAAIEATAAYVIAPPARVLGQPVRQAAALPAARTQAYPSYAPSAEPVPSARRTRPRCTATRYPPRPAGLTPQRPDHDPAGPTPEGAPPP